MSTNVGAASPVQWLRPYGTRPAAHAGYWAALLAIMAMGYALYLAADRENDLGQRVHQTLAVLHKIAQVRELVSRADSYQRGFILAGGEHFRSERDEALASLDREVASLKALTADSPEQQSRLRSLEKLIAARVEIMHESVRVKETEGLEAASKRTAGPAETASQMILAVTDAMRRAKLELLEARRAEERLGHERTIQILVLAVLLSATVIVPGYVAFILEARARYKAERRLLDMAESLPGAVFQFRRLPDGAGRYEFLSSGTSKVRGVSREAALKDPQVVFGSILEEDRAGFFSAARESEETFRPLEHDYRIRNEAGNIRWLHTSALPFRQADGSTLWSGHWADVTEKKMLEHALVETKEAAEMANRAKSTFLATMSHEIRTPMNGLLGMLDLLALTKLDAEQKATLAVVRTSAKSLLRIIDDILDFSKVEAGKLDLRPEPASLNTIVKSTVGLYAGNASSKGLTVRASLDKDVWPAVVVDPVRLQQILNNLVSNAIKFTERGHVEIRTQLLERSADRQVVRFSVNDSGVGMSPEEQARLFQPFTQLVRQSSRGSGGTGLGLSICMRLAQLMGGTIDVVSSPGRGTSMSVTIPMEVSDAALPEVDPAPAQSGPPVDVGPRREPPDVAQAEREGTLVLLADDHPVNRLVLERQLAALGYAAHVAKDGLEALALSRTKRFGIVITDCNMPAMDGFELARRIRTDEAAGDGRRVPIIACTANAMGGDAERCFDSGMDDYIAKPVELSDLARKLDHWLPLPASEAGLAGDRSLPESDKRQPLDPSILAHYSGGDRALERELLAQFRSSNELDIATLEQAMDQEDSARITQALHRINGASRTIGAFGLAEVCASLEQASRKGDLEAVRARLPGLYRELERLQAWIGLH